MTNDFKAHFEAASARVLGELRPGEQAAISYIAERTSYMRFNNGKIRQSGTVEQTEIAIKLWKGAKSYALQLGLSGEVAKDDERIAEAIGQARATMPLLPDDPYQAIPESSETSDARYDGKLIP